MISYDELHRRAQDGAWRIPLLAATAVVLMTFATTAAAKAHDAEMGTSAGAAGSTPDPTYLPAAIAKSEGTVDGTFTVGDVTAGRVPDHVQDAFWEGQHDAILRAPCRDATTGSVTVTMFVGATDAWAARLDEAIAEHAERCAG